MSDKGYAENTIKKVYSILSDVLKYAVNNDLLIKNPCQGISIPKGETKERRVLTRGEQDLFLQFAKDSPYYSIYLTALTTGMRVGELLALNWEKVDFEKAVITVDRTLLYIQAEKGKKGELKIQSPKTRAGNREIPMIPELSRALRRYKIEQNTLRLELGSKWQAKEELGNLVFTTQFGSPLRESYVNKNMERIINKINVKEQAAAKKENREPVLFENISPHGLRHTFATRAFENGMKDKAVQEIMGHSSLAMTMDLYTHVTQDVKAEEIQKLSNVFQA